MREARLLPRPDRIGNLWRLPPVAGPCVGHAPEEVVEDNDPEQALTLQSALLPEFESKFGGGRP